MGEQGSRERRGSVRKRGEESYLQLSIRSPRRVKGDSYGSEIPPERGRGP